MEYYLMVSCLCSIINLTSAAHALRKVEKQDYVIKDNKAFIEMIVINVIIKSFVPGYRIYFLFKRIENLEEYVNEIIQKGIEKGFIEKLEDESTDKIDNDLDNKVEENSFEEDKNSVITYNTINRLTREQKIKFLKEEYMRLTGKDIEEETKKGKQKRR